MIQRNAGEMLRGGSPYLHERGILEAGKPWPDRDKAPWGDGDSDGEEDRSSPYPDGPGDESKKSPSGDPEIRARAALIEGAERCAKTNPKAWFAQLAIEARLAEITLHIATAKSGATGAALSKLIALERFI